jgi:hypothetical protein
VTLRKGLQEDLEQDGQVTIGLRMLRGNGDLRRATLYVYVWADANGLTDLLETLKDHELDTANGGVSAASASS